MELNRPASVSPNISLNAMPATMTDVRVGTNMADRKKFLNFSIFEFKKVAIVIGRISMMLTMHIMYMVLDFNAL